MSVGALSAADISAVRAQLGREPTTEFSVVARCMPDGHPLVIRNAPVDAEGKPFPTRFWLTCPDAVRAVSRVEAAGGVRLWNERLDADPGLAAEVAACHGAYASERDGSGPALPGGIGGTRVGVKCLHAHLANHIAGGVDPVGAEVAVQIEPFHDLEIAYRVAAAIDQGTNSTRLLVLGEVDAARGPVELARDMTITRLGKDVDSSGSLDAAAMQRATDTIARFVRRARALGAERIRVAATSAVRDAANREDFVAAIRVLHPSVRMEVLSGREEAEVTFAGAISDIEGEPPYLVIDIGGGSTEFVLGDREEIRGATSTQMGSVRLTERCVRSDPVTREELAALRDEVHAVLDGVDGAIPVRAARTVIAVAGTTTTVQGIASGLTRYDPDLIHGTRLSLGSARRVLARLAAEGREARASHPVMPAGREEVIVAGAVILVETMARFGLDPVVVSEHDILDGLAVAALRER